MTKRTRSYSEWQQEKLAESPLDCAHYLMAAAEDSKEMFLVALKNISAAYSLTVSPTAGEQRTEPQVITADKSVEYSGKLLASHLQPQAPDGGFSDIVATWDRFYRALPDGEYVGLGQMRMVMRELGWKLEKSEPQAGSECWISAKDRLPEIDEFVIWADPYNAACFIHEIDKDDYPIDHKKSWLHSRMFWQPLPEMPLAESASKPEADKG